MKDFSSFTISVEQAKEWTKNWREKNPKLTKGFLIPVEDLLGSLIEMGVVKTDAKGNTTINLEEKQMVRTYRGINKDGIETLIMVGTKKDGDNYNDIINEGEENSGVYDFTTNCPPNCDKNSPLN